MRVDHIDGAEDAQARGTVLLEPVLELADGDGYAEAREAVLGGAHLRGERRGGEHAVEERFAAELDCAGDELGLRIGEEYVSQFISPADPAIVAVKSELR